MTGISASFNTNHILCVLRENDAIVSHVREVKLSLLHFRKDLAILLAVEGRVPRISYYEGFCGARVRESVLIRCSVSEVV